MFGIRLEGKTREPYSQNRACLHRLFFFFEWGGFGVGAGLREIQRDSYYFSCQGENMRVVRLTNGRVSAAVESGKSLRRLMSLTRCDGLGLLMDARIWLRLAATLASTRPPVPASPVLERGSKTHVEQMCAPAPAVFICPDTRGRAAAQSEVVRRGKRKKKKEKKRKKPGTRSSSVFQESESQTLGFSRAHHAKWMIITCKYSLMRSCV